MRFCPASGRAAGLVLTLLVSCTPALPPAPSFQFDPGGVNEEQAFEEVRSFIALGPRASGTPNGETAAHYLRGRLQELGLEAELDVFVDVTPRGEVTFRNVVGRMPGPGPGLIILGSHFDTKSGVSKDFLGANDSGSSTGLLLELARTLRVQAGPSYSGPEIRFLFFDGEEAMQHYTALDGFHGSRHYARRLVSEDSAHTVQAVVVMDMVGDRDLTVTMPRNCTRSLVSSVLQAAHAENARADFSLHPFGIGDDHEPFLALGMPAVNIIDFKYGSRRGLNDYWHTTEDTIDHISAESLGIVGRVVVRVVNDVMSNPAKFTDGN